MWFFVFLTLAFSDTRIQILHSSDIHSHFLNDSTPLRLGGVSRLKTKMDELRSQNENTLVLDAGDWTEGSIFFILNSGEANHRLMESMGYDAIVFGNHDWLVGPKEIYDGFQAAQMQVPILSANIDTKKLPADIPLDQFIKPYIIRWVDGKKIGIFGLSTFDLVFDPFLEPVEVETPVRAAKKYAKYLKEQEKCDLVIALTHIGIVADKMIAYAAPEIDLIVGGHTHILLTEPYIVEGTPIVHIGKWAWYLGQYEMVIPDDGRKPYLASHRIHQIDEKIPEDPEIKTLVEGFQSMIKTKWGNIWNDKKIHTDINLPLGSDQYEYHLGNVAVDAIRESTRAEFAVDSASYRSQEMYRGFLNTVDFFNLFPHNWSTRKDRAWNIFEFEIKGYLLKFLVNAMFVPGPGIMLSNGKVVLDQENMIEKVHSFKIANKEVSSTKYYKVAGTEGVMEVLKYVQSIGMNLHLRRVRDTGIEAWRQVQKKMERMGNITRDNLRYEGRIRSLQPDLFVIPESIAVHDSAGLEKILSFMISNMGLKPAKVEKVKVVIDQTPENTLDNTFQEIILSPSKAELKAGESQWLSVRWNIANRPNGVYPVKVEVVGNDYFRKNNVMDSFVYIFEEESIFSFIPDIGKPEVKSTVLRSDYNISN
jgi:5'-nucleotidase / UDP-sugar diphosphatase